MHADYTGQGFDQLLDVIDKIKSKPDDRRIILSTWNPSDINIMALPPCHMFAQFYVANGKLSCQMYQRSADMVLGVPFNIASYSLVTYILLIFVLLGVGLRKKCLLGLKNINVYSFDNLERDINEPSIDGGPLLDHACMLSNFSCFKLLVERGANIDVKSYGGDNILHTACLASSIEVVEFIFTNYFDIAIKMLGECNMLKELPLHVAVTTRNTKIVKLFLEASKNYDPNLTQKMIQSIDLFGNTALHNAAKRDNAKIVKLLLEEGASKQHINIYGQVPHQMAKRDYEVWKLLVN